MSLQAALEEERQQVLRALEGTTETPVTRKARGETPPPPVRSMLDVSTPVPRHGSIAGIGVGVTAGARQPQNRSNTKLDPSDPSTYTSRHTSFSSQDKSGIAASSEGQDKSQRSTESVEKAAKGLPKIQNEKKDIGQEYRFDMSPTALPPGQSTTLRATQAGKRPREGSGSAMSAALSGDFSSLHVGHVGLPRGAASGRHNSTAGIGAKSRSPSSRITFARPDSPGAKMAKAQYVTDSGKVVDLDQAFRRLSNKSGGTSSFSTIGSEMEDGVRVPKDSIKDDDEAAVESSEEEEEEPSSEEEESLRSERGRNRGRRKKSPPPPPPPADYDWEDDDGGEEDTPLGMGRAGSPREAQSQMAAAEQERQEVSSAQPALSPLAASAPLVSVTSPTGDMKTLPKKGAVHPISAYDHGASASYATSQASSDEQENTNPLLADISKARKLALNISGLDTSVPDRIVQIVLRGDWNRLQQEADEGRRRQRLYLVATDLSDESVYALEWTVGTILRDGDTLLAVCAIENENVGKEGDRETLQAEGAKAARDAEKTMERLTEKTKQQDHSERRGSLTPMKSPVLGAHLMQRPAQHGHSYSASSTSATLSPTLTSFVPATESTSATGSVDSRNVSKAQMERLRAVEQITATCVRLLRKTRLQVRVTVEVVTCRSPKHLITGAIDVLDPTLVILGSRGRSALKGVLLGSFSNYLVTKSSVPVMVARKKLRKPANSTKKKLKEPHLLGKSIGDDGLQPRLSNNLDAPRTVTRRRKLHEARIERNPIMGRR